MFGEKELGGAHGFWLKLINQTKTETKVKVKVKVNSSDYVLKGCLICCLICFI